MKFDKTLKQNIIQYILEKTASHEEHLSKHVATAFNININTVHTYINGLINDGYIVRSGRDKYDFKTESFNFEFSRKNGELKNETTISNNCLEPYISKLPKNIQNIWNYAFNEIINNVIDHSEAETLNIVIEQNYFETTIRIADNGVGIFKKIKEHFELDSIDDAVVELSKGKLTTDKSNHSGEGIFFTSRIMDNFFIYSDNKFYSYNKFREEKRIDIENKYINGTFVMLNLSNFSNKNLKDIFDKYSNDDGDFTKTKIPIRQIFDGIPISRSQAKRVCARLENFKEVEIDFSDIDFIGQGFAHEMFVVFANNNPDVKLQPINMNDDVKKMYHHVTA